VTLLCVYNKTFITMILCFLVAKSWGQRSIHDHEFRLFLGGNMFVKLTLGTMLVNLCNLSFIL